MMFSRKYVLFFGLVFLGILLLKFSMPIQVMVCNKKVTQERFSCYRKVIENNFRGDLTDYLVFLEDEANLNFHSDDNTYAIFGTNCHTFYHALGDFIAKQAKDVSVEEGLGYCPSACTSGCMMGFYKRKALESGFDTQTLKALFEACRPNEKNQCAHEIGHVLHDKYTEAILKILDEISSNSYGLTPGDYNYRTFSEDRLDEPFEECREIVGDEPLIDQCYTGIGHNLFLYSEFSDDRFESQFDNCMETQDENREACNGYLLFRIGINEVATRFLSGDFEGGKEICNQAVDYIGSRDQLFHCYRGVGGGLGLFIESEYQPSDSLEGDDLYKLRTAVVKASHLCDQVPEDQIGECYQGLVGTRFRQMYLKLELFNERVEELINREDLKDFKVTG